MIGITSIHIKWMVDDIAVYKTYMIKFVISLASKGMFGTL